MYKYDPELKYIGNGNYLPTMEPSDTGEYVNIQEVYEWLMCHRKDVPATGEEIAREFISALGLGKYFEGEQHDY